VGRWLRVRHTARDVVDTLGPGRRSVVWVQGCHVACPGCMVPEMWNPDVGGTLVDPVALAAELLGSDPSAQLTVSGGEPTEQPAAVGALLRAAHRLGRTTWVYTGRTLEELLDDDDVVAMLADVDVLVDGRYEQSRPTSRPYRGSANQRIINLTGVIPTDGIDRGVGRVSVTLDGDGGIVVVGVPPPRFLRELRERLERRGITVSPEQPWQ
jgi:anaerobic ribonucleoside-triphosphate reductase activating protein